MKIVAKRHVECSDHYRSIEYENGSVLWFMGDTIHYCTTTQLDDGIEVKRLTGSGWGVVGVNGCVSFNRSGERYPCRLAAVVAARLT